MENRSVRITGPGAVVAAVPSLCGFVPQESLVAICLQGPRRRIGLTLRVDLPAVRDDVVGVAELAARLEHEQPAAVVLVVCTDAAGDRPHQELLDRLCDALDDVHVLDRLLLRSGRWRSYDCDDLTCCPADGQPVPEPAAALVAEAAYGGRAVLPDRAALAASFAPPAWLAARVAEQQLDEAMEQWLLSVADQGLDAARRDAVAAVRDALAFEVRAEPAEAASLVAGLQDVVVRDEVATLALDDTEALLSLLLALARQSVAPYDVPVCTLVALVAWVRGDGALANVALDRALAGDPAYSMALLLRTGLDGQLPPKAVREWLEQTRSVLRPRRKGTAA